MNQFLQDVQAGLSAPEKHLTSKYFYDEAGSQIFQEIMAMPEYYLTRCEFEILSTQAVEISRQLDFESLFDVVELGAGDGSKTLELLAAWEAMGLRFRYIPIDVSAQAIADLQALVATRDLQFEVWPQIGDYFDCLRQLEAGTDKLFLFLGANIGNYTDAHCDSLLTQIKAAMQGRDLLMIGFDLQKDAEIIQRAYDDPHGITKRFNINLLHRINRELGGHFIPDQFDFRCTYNPDNGELKSYLISRQEQQVRIDALDQAFSFAQGEAIHTELSKKYAPQEIAARAEATGFAVKANFFDPRNYFVDSLWQLGQIGRR
jgi:L-histidine Nalpha-methyltransferase